MSSCKDRLGVRSPETNVCHFWCCWGLATLLFIVFPVPRAAAPCAACWNKQVASSLPRHRSHRVLSNQTCTIHFGHFALMKNKAIEIHLHQQAKWLRAKNETEESLFLLPFYCDGGNFHQLTEITQSDPCFSAPSLSINPDYVHFTGNCSRMLYP